MGILAVAREFFEVAFSLSRDRDERRAIGERLCELAEQEDFEEAHRLSCYPQTEKCRMRRGDHQGPTQEWAVAKFWDSAIPEPNTGCWLWMPASAPYGRIQWGGRPRTTSHVAFELTHGPIPDGQFVLHRCDTPACINSDHLFAGTKRDNILDALKKGRYRNHNAEKTACIRGHALVQIKGSHRRRCPICQRNAASRSARKARALLKAKSPD